MNGHRRRVVEALEALQVHSIAAYSWLGQRFEPDDPAGLADPGAALMRSLEGRLYADFYLTGGVAPAGSAPEPRPGPWYWTAIDELSDANRGHGSLDPGWTVRALENGSVVVERDGLHVRATRDEVRSDAARVAVGDRVGLIVPKEHLGLPGGFYVAYGDAGRGPDPDRGPLDRFYWNVRREGRPALVRALTRSLNELGMPFRLKVLTDPMTARCDAAVLYTPAEGRQDVLTVLVRVHPTLDAHLLPRTPVFTRTLARGLGFAEHPPGQESFGTHRCTLLAGGLVRGHAEGARSLEARLRVVEAAFADAGVSLDRPYLNPGADARRAPAPLAS